ncbi:hypothetical protein [Moraxella nonliquefaciens]|uniref:hypothetical protein n=1 Tax=Moraxella nonliquefaciens TaxID=478 RepID=UPI00081F6B24|nr:hypothetical protein [Moraxella nonliquefaciens]OBX50025.1 hypothetical protein A9Z65_08250 [Moraxella nonliquefaciens]
MKKLSILALSATVAITPAFAETTAHYNTPITELSTKQADLSFAFDDVENLQAVAMTDGQMQETQGAWVTTAFGAAVGGVGYAYGAYKGNYQWDNRKFASNVASGAVIGTLTGGAGFIASGGAKFIPSLTNAGANIWRANGAIVNTGVNTAWRR